MTERRLASLDLIRGFAILGMLWVNVPWHIGDSMSRVDPPTASNLAIWLGQYLLVSDKMQPIFAMLFGAGIALQFERAERRGTPYEPIFRRRMAWLFAIGVAHAYLIWPGDILITYSLCGVLIYRFRDWSFRRLVLVGAAIKGVNLVFLQWPDAYDATLYRLLFAWWFDAGPEPMSGVEAYAGSYRDLLRWNAWRNQTIQWTAMPYFRFWGSCGPMLIGMALIRLPLLRSDCSPRLCLRFAAIAAAIGLPPMLYGLLGKIGHNETVGPALGFTRELPLSTPAFAAGSFFVALVYLALAAAFAQRTTLLGSSLAAVGRTALTNYIAQSVICLLLLRAGVTWNTWDQSEQLRLTAVLWVVEPLASLAWLRVYSQGPLEWAWRRLAGSPASGPKSPAGRFQEPARKSLSGRHPGG